MWLVFAMSASVCFGIRGILYQWSSQKTMNRNLMLCGVFFTGAVLGAVLSLAFGSDWSPAVLMGIIMGIFSFVASMSMYRGFAVGKASLIAVLTGMPPVVVIVLAFLIWGEKLSAWQFIAFVVILTGILMIRYSSDLSFKQLRGAGWGLLCMLCFGLNDMSSKQATRLGADVFPTLFFMFLTGTVLFFVWYWAELRLEQKKGAPDLAESAASRETPWSNEKSFFWGMAVGTTNVGGMIFIFRAFEIGVTGLVSAVVALSVLLILLYSRLFLKEKFSPLELAGITFAIAGIILLRVFD